MSTAPQPLKLLFVTPEVTPLAKTGGLADVSAALPAALRTQGVDVRVLVPGYDSVMDSLGDARCVATLSTALCRDDIRLLEGALPGSGVPLLVVDCPAYFHRAGGPYADRTGCDWPDNAHRFALLAYVAATLAGTRSPLEWRPHILQCNDWQSGLAPAYLNFMPGPRAATVMTIHNLAFQGTFPPSLTPVLGLPKQSFNIQGVEYYGRLSFLKAGLYYADHITTVSPTYAEEIQQEALGFGMQGLLAHRYLDLTGILNGIDTEEWNPAKDPFLSHSYSAEDLSGKADNKRFLQARLGLAQDTEVPLLGVVSRLTHQKGLDLLLTIAPILLERSVQLAVLGSGENGLENAFLELARSRPGQVACVIGFDEGLSHQIEAGADIFLMPSRFEPCGLNQMYSQRYGTPPIVHATGGLVDTVVDTTSASLDTGMATGFVFAHATPHGLQAAVERALAAFWDKETWRRIQHNGMRRDFGWHRSAEEYLALYHTLLAERQYFGAEVAPSASLALQP